MGSPRFKTLADKNLLTRDANRAFAMIVNRLFRRVLRVKLAGVCPDHLITKSNPSVIRQNCFRSPEQKRQSDFPLEK